MVKTFVNQFAAKQRRTIDNAIDRFGKTVTHRLTTETKDANGRITAETTADATMKVDIQANPRALKSLISVGALNVGDALLIVSANDSQASSITPHVSVVIEGTATGSSYTAWEVHELIDNYEVGGVICHYEFRLVKTQPVTL